MALNFLERCGFPTGETGENNFLSDFGFGQKPLIYTKEGLSNRFHFKIMFASLASPLEIRKAEEFFLPPPFERDPVDDFLASIGGLIGKRKREKRPPKKAKKKKKPKPKTRKPNKPSRGGKTTVRTERGGKRGEMHLRLKGEAESSDILRAIEGKEGSFLSEYDFLVAHKVSKFSSASYLILLAQHRKTLCALPLYPITLSSEHDSFEGTLDACLEKLSVKHSSLSSGKGLKIPQTILGLK